MDLKVKYLENYKKEWDKLKYEYPSDSGFDLRAATNMNLTLFSEYGAKIPTGVSFEIPLGYELQIRPKSGLASKGLIILNSPGTIDAGYRGEVFVTVMFLGRATKYGVLQSMKNITIVPGMKIAQAVLAPVTKANLIEVEQLSPTLRADGGFGSTGEF